MFIQEKENERCMFNSDRFVEFLCLVTNQTEKDSAVRNLLLEIAALQDLIHSIESKNALIFYCKHLYMKVPLNRGYTLRFIQSSNNPTSQWLSLANFCLSQCVVGVVT